MILDKKLTGMLGHHTTLRALGARVSHVPHLLSFDIAPLQMILDKKLNGTLDQGAGCLEVFAPAPPDSVYPAALDVMSSLGRVVDTLFARSQRVVA